MFRQRKRQIVFVCTAVKENSQLLSEIIAAESDTEASNIFLEKFNIKPQSVLGPFIKKKLPPVQINQSIKFAGIPKKAIYNDWLVNAFLLKEPINHAFLIFIKKVNGDSQASPKGTTIVPINDIRFI